MPAANRNIFASIDFELNDEEKVFNWAKENKQHILNAIAHKRGCEPSRIVRMFNADPAMDKVILPFQCEQCKELVFCKKEPGYASR